MMTNLAKKLFWENKRWTQLTSIYAVTTIVRSKKELYTDIYQ